MPTTSKVGYIFAGWYDNTNFEGNEITTLPKEYVARTTTYYAKWTPVTDMGFMFSGCSNLTTLDVSGFDTSNVTNMSKMFGGCSSLTELEVSNFDTSNVTSMFSMFYGCSSLTTLDISDWITSNVTNMSYMFNGCSNLTTLDVSGIDTRNVTNMNYMLYDCSNLTTIYASDNFVTNQVEDSTNMFGRCSKLIGGNGTTYNSSHKNKEYARIDTEETPGYFTSKEDIITAEEQDIAMDLSANEQEEIKLNDVEENDKATNVSAKDESKTETKKEEIKEIESEDSTTKTEVEEVKDEVEDDMN